MTIDDIKRITSEVTNVSVDQIEGRRRIEKISLARQIAIFLSKKHLAQGHKEIGEAFNRDQSYVSYVKDQIGGLLSYCPNVAKLCESAENKIKKLKK